MSYSTPSLSVDLMRPLPRVGAAIPGTDVRSRIDKTAKDFEAAFLSNAFSTMFSGINISEPFGGGEGEEAFKSFLMDSFAKQMTRSGGVGLAASVTTEMLKMQGLEPEPKVQDPKVQDKAP
jgi:Rod binding domain-containing protein